MAILTSIPTQCHLWKKGDPSEAQLYNDLDTLKVYEDDSHLIRKLKKCKDCGQLYFYEFLEWIDWEGGHDPQYRTWIPVDDESSADTINELSPLEILRFPSVQSDFASNDGQPAPPIWIVGKDSTE